MIINSVGNTETNCTIENNVFKIQASPIAFEILSSKLYANPILAVVRELLTNAYDSHKAAKKLNIPIKVTFPSGLEKNFSIRDYGIGLSKEDVMEMYTTFFSSTKSNSNDFTGCFGLGSKTPFSYAPSFSVNSYWNGIKYYFAAVKKDGYPSIYCIREEVTDEDNGLEIIIPTPDYDNQFYGEAVDYLKYIPEIIIDSNKDIIRKAPLCIMDNFFIYRGDTYNSYQGALFARFFIKQGQNVYTVEEFVENKDLKLNFLHKILKKNIIVANVPIGTLDITPSRESLSKDTNNVEKVINYLIQAEEELKKIIINDKDTIKSLDNEVYDQIISEKYFGTNSVEITTITDTHTKEIIPFVKIKDCYLYYVSESKSNCASDFISSKTELIVIANDYPEKKDLTKLKNTICNHSDDIDDLTLIIPKNNNKSLLEFVKRIKKTVKILNSIEEYDFNFEIMNINQFYKKYPNHKRPRTSSLSTKGKRIYRKSYELNLDRFKNKNVYHCSKHIAEIDYIKLQNLPSNTIIIEGIDDMTRLHSNFIDLLNIFIHRIKDKQGNYFVYDYLKKKLPNLTKDKIDAAITGNENLSNTLDILFIAKSNFRFFKGYQRKITINSILELINKTDFEIQTIDANISNAVLNDLNSIKNTFKYSFKKKSKIFIEKSTVYKSVDILINRYKKMLGEDLNHNFIPSYQLDTLKIFSIKYKERKPIQSQNCLYPKIEEIKNIIINSPMKRLRVDEGNKQFKYKTINFLYNDKKLIVLKLIRGEKPNVLFQR